MNKELEEVVTCIRESKDYKECIRLKSLMERNEEIKELVSNIKELQKKYIRSGYDEVIKEELDSLEKRLYSIPIYDVYQRHLDEVNLMINYVKDELNEFCDGYKRIYIYGAGLYGKMCWLRLKAEDKKIEGFLVTKLDGETSIEGIPVYQFSDEHLGKDNGIIIAIQPINQQFIVKEIKKRNPGFSDYYSFDGLRHS